LTLLSSGILLLIDKFREQRGKSECFTIPENALEVQEPDFVEDKSRSIARDVSAAEAVPDEREWARPCRQTQERRRPFT